MGLTLINPSAVEPVSLSEIKDFLRIDLDDDTQDGVLTALSMAARSWCEVYVRRRFVQQTWRLLMDSFPGYIDTKLAGAKVSSPFVSGSNAILVGIRYAIALPYPPAGSVTAFIYQNANGQVTSMIVGPLNIGGVTNVNGRPVGINTTVPHGLASGATISIAGNSALIALLGGASQAITVTDANDFTVNGSVGTGSSISAAGTVTGYNYVQDLQSNPARLTPLFGQMWPVARVVVNAVQVDFTCGFGIPIALALAANSAIVSGYTFASTDTGRPISIPGAGLNGGTLNTVVQSVDGGGVGTLRDKSQTAVPANSPALLVNCPSGNPALWESIKTGIKLLTANWYEKRIPDESNIPMAVKAILYPARDLRF